MAERSRPHPAVIGEEQPASRERKKAGWLVASAVLAVTLLLACGWTVTQRRDLRALVSGTAAGNLLVDGSFEQPAMFPVGLMQTFGRPWSPWQKLQFWFQTHSPFPRRTGLPFSLLAGPAEMPGWRVTQGSVDVTTKRYWQPAPGQGTQTIDLVGTPGAGTIEQALFTRPGQEYLFSGWLAHNPENPVAPMGRAHVYLNNQFFAELLHRDAAATKKNMRWRPFSYRFRATSVRTTLKIRDMTNTYPLCGAVLDGLSITPAPPHAPRGQASSGPAPAASPTIRTSPPAGAGRASTLSGPAPKQEIGSAPPSIVRGAAWPIHNI
jgi:hypothetical protein